MVALVVEIEGTVDGRGESTGSHNTTQHSLQLRTYDHQMGYRRVVSFAGENFRELLENMIFVENTFANLW